MGDFRKFPGLNFQHQRRKIIKFLKFPLKIIIFDENSGFCASGKQFYGFLEVPRGFMVRIYVYYGGIYVFIGIGCGFPEKFVRIWKGMGDFRKFPGL